MHLLVQYNSGDHTHTIFILTWRGTETWSPKPMITEVGVLFLSKPLHAGFVTGYGYDFGCTPDAEFLIAWGCALAPTPHPNQLNKSTSSNPLPFLPFRIIASYPFGS